MVDAGKRESARAAIGTIIDRMRDDSLDAVIALGAVGHGRLFIDAPRSPGKPVDATLVMGGLQLALFETREIA